MWSALQRLGAACLALAASEDSQCLLQKEVSARQAGHLAANLAANLASNETKRSDAPGDWAILELTDYETEGSWDWWSEGDIYAYVVLHPSGFEYKSEVQYNQNKGNVKLNIYVPTSVDTITVTLYDHHDWFKHDLVGSTTFKPSTDCGNDDICSITMRFRSSETIVEEVARLEARWITGAQLRPAAEAANKQGIWVHYEEASREKSVYKLASVQMGDIDKEILFARTGSVFPASLHGIHWMDQRGTSLRDGPYEEDPDYKQTCSLAADEVFVSFGEASWDPETKCVKGVRQFGGGPLSGHWSWLDQGGKTSTEWSAGEGWNMKYDFCFRDEAMTFIDVLIRIAPSRVISDTLGLPSLFPPHVEVTVPTWLNGVAMVKTPWGWDRVTTIGPSWLRTLIRSVFQSWVIQAVFGMGVGLGGDFISDGLTCHYPLLPIVDGDGTKTKWFAEYEKYVNTGTTCDSSSFDCPVNKAPGTVVIGRLQEF